MQSRIDQMSRRETQRLQALEILRSVKVLSLKSRMFTLLVVGFAAALGAYLSAYLLWPVWPIALLASMVLGLVIEVASLAQRVEALSQLVILEYYSTVDGDE